jgi:hypothetical protein
MNESAVSPIKQADIAEEVEGICDAFISRISSRDDCVVASETAFVSGAIRMNILNQDVNNASYAMLHEMDLADVNALAPIDKTDLIHSFKTLASKLESIYADRQANMGETKTIFDNNGSLKWFSIGFCYDLAVKASDTTLTETQRQCATAMGIIAGLHEFQHVLARGMFGKTGTPPKCLVYVFDSSTDVMGEEPGVESGVFVENSCFNQIVALMVNKESGEIMCCGYHDRKQPKSPWYKIDHKWVKAVCAFTAKDINASGKANVSLKIQDSDVYGDGDVYMVLVYGDGYGDVYGDGYGDVYGDGYILW